jgi:hypothetical protein
MSDQINKKEITVSNDEFTKLVNKVDALENTFSEWKGSLNLVKWLFASSIGLGLLILGTMISLGTSLISQVNSHTTQLAITQEKYDSFMSRGPRFTPEDYAQNIRADKAEIYQRVREMIEDTIKRNERQR